MVSLVYLLPVVACLFAHFVFRYDGSPVNYLWILLAGWGVIGVAHLLCRRRQVTAYEFLGSYVESVVHEEAWEEKIVRRETRTVNGRSETVTRVEWRFHPDVYMIHTSRGSWLSTNRRYYKSVADYWGVKSHRESYYDTRIRTGVRFINRILFRDSPGIVENPLYIPVTERCAYRNPIVNSNSIFRTENISDEDAYMEGLYPYPAINNHDAPALLSSMATVTADLSGVDMRLRIFNAVVAPGVEMRLFVLLFNADKGVEIAERQRMYWKGGNKNEFTVCLGVDGDKVAWAHAFSWSDDVTLAVKVRDWFVRNPAFNLDAFLDWFLTQYSDFSRKEFSDFGYLRPKLTLWQILAIILVSVVENVVALLLLFRG